MRKHGRTDGNQTLIVRALRDAGATVAIVSSVGNGFPDLLVGWGPKGDEHCALVEIKDPAQDLNKRRLTHAEKVFHQNWRGPIYVVETVDEALRILQR